MPMPTSVQGRIIQRLLGQQAGENAPDQNSAFEPARVEGSFLRPTYSQYASLHVASPITCLDKSQTGNRAVIAGYGVFKTVHIYGSTILEEIDLRPAIATQGSSHDNTLSAFSEQLNIKAVAWSHGELDSTIITASANGKVTLYDLNRIGSEVEIGRIQEHARQVHKLAINPYKGNWLLSASQDGTARLFDIKSAALRHGGQTFKSWSTFRCNADAVRDIKWSPTDGFKFACSTASGAVLYWDTRKSTAPILKISAHDSACLSISWHPDGEHLISGGLDQKCHVWNLSENAERKQKAKYTIATPAPVSIVSWRPPCWSSTAQAKRAAQVAVVYDDTNPMKIQNSTVHVWDCARPGLPFKEVIDFETSPTGLIWHELDLLWTVGREGEFTQTDVAFAPKVIDRRSLSTFDFSPSGEVLLLLEERQGVPRPRPHVTSTVSTEIASRPINPDDSNHSPTTGQLGISRSDSEEDISGSFLGPRPHSKKQGQRHIARSANTLSTTPPSVISTDGNVMKLDEAVKSTGSYKPQQVMTVGHAPSAIKRDVFQYLSSQYLQHMIQDVSEATVVSLTQPSICDRLSTILEHFAKSAENVGHFRLAQTWRILSFTMGHLLKRRAQYHRERRLASQDEKRSQLEKEERKVLKEKQRQSEQDLQDELTPLKLERPRSPTEGVTNPFMKSIITEEAESTSNMTTPQARPVRDSMIFNAPTAVPESTIDNDRLELTPAAQSTSESPMKISERGYRAEDTPLTVDGYDFYDMEVLTTPAIDIAAPKRAPLRLDLRLRDQGEQPKLSSLARYDSNESFQMFSTSGDSNSRKYPSSSESGGHGSLPHPAYHSVPNVDSSWDSSALSSNSRRNRSPEYEDTQNLNVDSGCDSQELSRLPPTLRVQKASPDATHIFENGEIKLENMSSVLSVHEEKDGALNIIESDYLPRLSDPPFLPSPIDPHVLVPRTIEFETLTNCLSASVMVLLLRPLLLPDTLDEVQSSAILRQFHHRLDSMMLFTEAALLRKLCYPHYPSVYSQGQPKNIGSMGYYCTTCGKPVKGGDLILGQQMQKCFRCNTYFDGCAVCNMREDLPLLMDADIDGVPVKGHDPKTNNVVIDPSSPAARIWWWCQGCGHGGHTACMRAWHSADGANFSDGYCPLEGCLHPCLPGTGRCDFFGQRNDVKSEELGKRVKESTRGGPNGLRAGGVKRDKTEVPESKAVESVRGALVGGSVQMGERERRKSVKVIAPHEK